MATECFCGCGRAVRQRARRLNLLGATVQWTLDEVEAQVLPVLRWAGLEDDHLPGFVAAGRGLRADLAAACHSPGERHAVDRRLLAAWLRHGATAVREASPRLRRIAGGAGRLPAPGRAPAVRAAAPARAGGLGRGDELPTGQPA